MKTNPYLKIAVLTGIVQVAKEGIFSGLNNVITYNTLENKFEHFWFEWRRSRRSLKIFWNGIWNRRSKKMVMMAISLEKKRYIILGLY